MSVQGERLASRLSRAVRDERVLEAIATVPRELFVPASERREAWRNRPLPIGEGQTISQPLVVARMAELLALTGGERVLDIGTGSGYAAAILAALARHVWSIERHASLSRAAADSLAAAGVADVTLIVGDGTRGHPEAAPYDAVHVGAAGTPEDLDALVDQLAPGGRLVAPVQLHDQRLVVVRRSDDGGRLERRAYEPVRFVPLVPDDRPGWS